MKEKIKDIIKALFASIGTGLLVFALIGIYAIGSFFLVDKVGIIWTLVIVFSIAVLIDFLTRIRKR